MKIEEAIQQKSFQDEYHKSQLNIIYTATWLNTLSTQALKPYDLSQQQFNVLRILRGMKGEPATIKLITGRMLDRSSNASRLVDKLADKGYVERKTCPTDRRRVDIWITSIGLDIVEQSSIAMSAMIQERSKSISIEEAKELSRILDKLRESE